MKEEYYIMTPEVKDHLELYRDRFDEWNNDEPYTPSFLFGAQERIFKFVSRFIDTDMEVEEVMKYLFGTIGGIAALILIVALFFI